jgi:hypothetical protein
MVHSRQGSWGKYQKGEGSALTAIANSVDEVAASVAKISALTGHRIFTGWSMGLVGAEIDHDQRIIWINGELDPVAFHWALARAFRRITQGAEAAPEFRPRLRLVR